MAKPKAIARAEANKLPWQLAVDKVRNRFRAVAGNDLVWQQEVLFAEAQIRRNKDLQAAIPETLGSSVLQAASLGLTLNPARNQCYLIARKTKRNDPNSPFAAYASPSYIGLSHIAVSAGACAFIRAEVVYEADAFVYRGPIEKPDHIPTLVAKLRDEARATGVYAVTKVGNEFLCEYLDRETVQRIRKRSEAPNGDMWNPQVLWTEGWKKAAIRRLLKTVPQPGRLGEALAVLNEQEGFVAEREVKGEVVRDTITRAQAGELRDLLRKGGLNVEKWEIKIATAYGVEALDLLPTSTFAEAKQRLQAGIDTAKQKATTNA